MSRAANLPRWRDVSTYATALRAPTRVSTLRATIDGLVVAVTLRRRGLKPLLREAGIAKGVVDPGACRDVSEAVDAALGLLPFKPTCLRRSMTLLRELRRLGLRAELHIGVRMPAGRVEAHAWVVAGAQVVNDDPVLIDTYEELVSGELDRFLPMLR